MTSSSIGVDPESTARVEKAASAVLDADETMNQRTQSCSRTIRGAFTPPEAGVALAIVAVILLGGVAVSRAAMSWAGVTIGFDSTAARLRVAIERVRDQFADASADSLRALATDTNAATPMVEGEPYDGVVAPTWRLYLAPGTNGARTLTLESHGSTTALATDLDRVQFTKSGRELVVELCTAKTADSPALALSAAVALR